MGGIANSSSETVISIVIDRENLFQVFGDEVMLEDYDFGGISGGPVLAIVQTPTIRSWMPVGRLARVRCAPDSRRIVA